MVDKDKRDKSMRKDVFTGEPIDIGEMVSKMAKHLSETDSGGKRKMSYSISPVAQGLIKTVAQETGATQGSIVEIAPLLFAKIAADSLERRASILSTLKTLHDQIDRSLNSFGELAPHLSAYTDQIKTLIGELLLMEETAIEEKNFQGTDPTGYHALGRLKIEKQEKPPYDVEINKFMEGNEWLETIQKV